MEHKSAIATVDIVLLTLIDEQLTVGLQERTTEPFAQKLGLVGGFVHTDTDADSRAAARRTLEFKTGIKAPYLEQLYTFSGPDRDPRGWSFSVTYYALVNAEIFSRRKIVPMPVDHMPELAFDHNEIVEFAVKRLRDKSSYSALPCYLLPAEFTLTELQQTYEKVTGEDRKKATFRRMLDSFNFLEEVPGGFRLGNHKPAQLYRLKKEASLALFDRAV